MSKRQEDGSTPFTATEILDKVLKVLALPTHEIRPHRVSEIFGIAFGEPFEETGYHFSDSIDDVWCLGLGIYAAPHTIEFGLGFNLINCFTPSGKSVSSHMVAMSDVACIDNSLAKTGIIAAGWTFDHRYMGDDFWDDYRKEELRMRVYLRNQVEHLVGLVCWRRMEIETI